MLRYFRHFRATWVVSTFAFATTWFPAHAFAADFKVRNLCNETFTVDATPDARPDDTVGSLTIRALDSAGIPYRGTAAGINSIGDSPIGDRALEVISPTHMRAYGWCYSINGIEPDAMPDQIKITSNNDIVHWYFGFAEFKDGQWVSYCTPTHQAQPRHICPE